MSKVNLRPTAAIIKSSNKNQRLIISFSVVGWLLSEATVSPHRNLGSADFPGW